MSSTVACLECGLPVPVGKRVCPHCLAPQPTNRKGVIVAGCVITALLLIVWAVTKIVGQ